MCVCVTYVCVHVRISHGVIQNSNYKARSDGQLTRYVSFGQDGELVGPAAVT